MKHLLALVSLAACFWIAAPSSAQSTQPLDQDTTAHELGSFDSFMDGHTQIAEQLRKNPALVNDKDYLEDHPDLQRFLQQHPSVREEMQENPNAFMQQEQRVDAMQTRQELRNLDKFMDRHPEIAEQLRKDPSLINNQQFVTNHPELKEFLQHDGGTAQSLREDPNGFMQQEERFEHREDGADRDRGRGQLASLDNFLDNHPEIAEQVQKDPSLLTNQKFLKDHPALQTYLQQHQQVREEISANPNGFMQREQRFDQREDGMDRDRTRGQLASLDNFLDSHPEIAEQVRKDPSLLTNDKFMKQHPALQTYLQQHPGVREEISENPNAFMQREQRFDQREDGMDRDRTRGQLASLDNFLDRHPEIAEQVRKDPSLLTNDKFQKQHPALQTYLQQHPGVREEIAENPNNFMQREQRFDQREQQFDQRQGGMDRDRDRGQLASMDRFLDEHPEIAEQVRKDPSLLTNDKFQKQHPALQTYLKQNPQVREKAAENPNAFMQQEQRFDQRENLGQNQGRLDGDAGHGEMNGFGQFLGSHQSIAQQLAKNPSLASNEEYMENHPELKAYLQAHPEVQQQLKEHPQAFMQSAQQPQASKPAPKGTTMQRPQTKQY